VVKPGSPFPIGLASEILSLFGSINGAKELWGPMYAFLYVSGMISIFQVLQKHFFPLHLDGANTAFYVCPSVCHGSCRKEKHPWLSGRPGTKW
jgi:hypothetical protein